MSYISSSIGDSDIMDNRMDFTKMPFVNYTSFIIPIQCTGKVKTQMFFPANVSKGVKVNNNIKKLNSEKEKNPELFNYKSMDISDIYKIQTLKKLKKKEQMVPNTILKTIFTI